MSERGNTYENEYLRPELEFDRDFGMHKNAWIRDKRIAGNPGWLYLYLLSHDRGFRLTQTTVQEALGWGKDAHLAARRKLEKFGYLQTIEWRVPAGAQDADGRPIGGHRRLRFVLVDPTDVGPVDAGDPHSPEESKAVEGETEGWAAEPDVAELSSTGEAVEKPRRKTRRGFAAAVEKPWRKTRPGFDGPVDNPEKPRNHGAEGLRGESSEGVARRESLGGKASEENPPVKEDQDKEDKSSSVLKATHQDFREKRDDDFELGGDGEAGQVTVAASTVTLLRRLRAVGIPPRLARTSALIALAQELPPVVLSRLTGLDISSAIAWSNAIGANNNAYATAVIERVGMPLPTL